MKFILQEILKPAAHRVGSAIGVTVASLDYFSAGEIATIETASVLVLGFAVDLAVRKAL